MEKFTTEPNNTDEAYSSEVSELGSVVLRARLNYAIEQATNEHGDIEKGAE